MRKKLFFVMTILVLSLASCSSSKNGVVQPKQEEQLKNLNTDLMRAQETTALRAVGMGNDYDEKYARQEAIRDAKAQLAGFIETAVVQLTQEYANKQSIDTNKKTETDIKSFVEQTVSQKISSKQIGLFDRFRLSDGSIQIYVCMELTKPTNEVLGDIYDNLTDNDYLQIDYDKDKFINDNINLINELRDKVK